jgi:hypothetical protein
MAAATTTGTSAVSEIYSGPHSRSVFGMTEAWWSTVGEYQQAMLNFILERLSKDRQVFFEVVGCLSWTEAWSAQSLWAEETWRDYVSEMTKVLAIYTKHANAIRSRNAHFGPSHPWNYG